MNFELLKQNLIGYWKGTEGDVYVFTDTLLVKVTPDGTKKEYKYKLSPVQDGLLSKITFGKKSFSIDIGHSFRGNGFVPQLIISGNGVYLIFDMEYTQ